jgi:tetratricopeptide (TPR) repeat protein
VPRRLALRRVAQYLQLGRAGLADEGARNDWHRRNAAVHRLAGDPASALWHALQAADVSAFTAVLNSHALELAGHAETDALVERLAAGKLTPRQRIDLLLARAALQRNRQASDRELAALDEALRLAQLREDPLLLGIVHGALGKFHESRDVDRAFACYESSVAFFRDAGADRASVSAESGSDEALSAYVTTLVRLAWLYVLRNDPRARAVLDAADALIQQRRVATDVSGMLEQTWGEYWRRAGELERAVAAKHRALLTFERIGDRRSVLVTHLNLISLYWEAKDYQRAIDAARPIEQAAAAGPVEPAILASTHINLGLVLDSRGDTALAIAEYERALDVSLRANLRLQANRAHYNLAEVFYKRFAAGHDPAHEQRADAHVSAMLGAPSSEITPAMIDAARKLKGEVLGTGESSGAENRLLPMEAAIHTEAMAEIGRQRSLLALPVPAEEHARARLAIVSAYQAIVRKEYQATVAHLEAHGLSARFGAELVHLRAGATHESADRERALARTWTEQAQDLLATDRRSAVLAHLLREGAINKSGYAELCGVSPATASKHLVTLNERGLLQQTGKGPSTRYLLNK